MLHCKLYLPGNNFNSKKPFRLVAIAFLVFTLTTAPIKVSLVFASTTLPFTKPKFVCDLKILQNKARTTMSLVVDLFIFNY